MSTLCRLVSKTKPSSKPSSKMIIWREAGTHTHNGRNIQAKGGTVFRCGDCQKDSDKPVLWFVSAPATTDEEKR